MSRDDLSDVYLVHPNTLRRVWVGRMPHDNAWALAARCTLQLVVRQKGRDYELLPDGLTAYQIEQLFDTGTIPYPPHYDPTPPQRTLHG